MAPLKKAIYRYSLPLTKGGQREGLLIRLQSKGGAIGWGEVAPLPGLSRETLEEALEDLINWRKSSYPSVQWGRAAAKLDLFSPLTVPFIPVRQLEKDKIKVGHLSLEKAITKVQQSACSGVDMNQKWTLQEALSLAKACPHLEYFEEPLKPGEEAAKFPYPVALDESLRQGDMPPYPSIKMHTIKPTLHGYPLPQLIQGIDLILSSSYESPLGLYQIAKLAYRFNLTQLPMGLGTAHLFSESLFEETPYYADGFLHFPKMWTLKKNQVELLFDGPI